jgi:peptidoglycan hydrolase-like protein with peptidoglycan-binding domain
MINVSEGVQIPDSLNGATNGKLPADRLVVVIDGKPWKMLDYAAEQMRGFLAEASGAFGKQLTFIAGAGSAYRDYDRQKAMFLERHTPGGGPKQFEGRSWSLKPGKAQSATPGKSNHGWAVAGDLCWSIGGKDVAINGVERAKLRPIAAKYKIADTVRSENWHFCVMEPMSEATRAPMMDPGPQTAHTAFPLLSINTGAGEHIDAIRYLEYALVAEIGASLTVDATFDKSTEDAVKWFQGTKGMAATGVVDEATWSQIQWAMNS